MSDHDSRITQSVQDALEDLNISAPSGLLDEEIETRLRSKFEADVPVCPLFEPNLLERLHFLATCLQREAIAKAQKQEANSATVVSTENMSEDQLATVRSCQEYLQADYERRRQHMRQRFDVLKETFDNPEDVSLPDVDQLRIVDSSTPIDTSQFLLPSTTTTINQHAMRIDEPSTASVVDRGGRVSQEENRNRMPDFSAAPRQSSANSNAGGKGKPQQPLPGKKQQGRNKDKANQNESANGPNRQKKEPELEEKVTAEGRDGGGRGGNTSRASKRQPRPSIKKKDGNKDQDKPIYSSNVPTQNEKEQEKMEETIAEVTGAGGKCKSQTSGRKKGVGKGDQKESPSDQSPHNRGSGKEENADAGSASPVGAGKRKPQPSGKKKGGDAGNGDQKDSATGHTHTMTDSGKEIATELTSQKNVPHMPPTPGTDSSAQPNTEIKKKSNYRNRRRKKPAPK
jgi:hypothetical protein